MTDLASIADCLLPARGRHRLGSPVTGRKPRAHVILLDGTLSTLVPGAETNIGLIYKALLDVPLAARPQIFYEPGLQWQEWHRRVDVMVGAGINRQIRRAYGWLASRYRPGDKVYLMGYSRGAFAVRSLAGVIDRVGLLRPRFATERHVRQVYRHYESNPHGEAARRFARAFCHREAEIEMVGVFDTVKALGLRLPVLWRMSEGRHAFHSHHLGDRIRHGYHALALDEAREAFKPVMWEGTGDLPGHVEQVWFRGTHGDVGGQLSGFLPARGLSNVPLTWMLERAEACGLAMPQDWRGRFPGDPAAPSSGNTRGWGKIFLLRRARLVGTDPSERLHPSALTGRPTNRPVPPVPLLDGAAVEA